ncbi:hypothetical protein K505DRAFT_284130 [Melanomma pulvis-pyrius CBS 109.77]|uniref:Aminoglycoside phosphotransferase domain-containing protein n=1 Tax=Melanomma pulvis-pyrius CBS 109.77 TaxID=1314802 RepID=A0A6A6X0A5_9PLEO|nr:hypothetical protein K505DRAFT_284130 [Melanomma pulvis-pyrius CBS 109.77]
MLLLEESKKDALATTLSQELSATPFACSSLTHLSGGTTNFVFRGVLAAPIPAQDGNLTSSVIVKHSTDFVAVNPDFSLDVSRCGFEGFMLNSLNKFPAVTTSDHITINVPHIFQSSGQTNTQIIEDFPDAIDLKTVFVSPAAKSILLEPFSTSIGRALGLWLRLLHNWASAPAQVELRAEIGKNEPMRRLKRRITFESFIAVVEQFPELLEGHKEVLEDVKAIGMQDFERGMGNEGGEDWGIVHGDFWTGNVLLPDLSSAELHELDEIKLSVIDWEFAQFGHRAYDLGQMIGDLYERKHFKDVDGALAAIYGFINGYGEVSEEMAFRTAIHAGVHLICWYNRRPPKSPLKCTPEQGLSVVKLGRDFVVKGCKKDRDWFEGSVLASLFQK